MGFRCSKAIAAGKCKGAECCGIVPIESALYEENKDLIAVEITRIQDMDEQFKLLYTDDGLCAFLDREINQCSIYEQRPKVCRLYGKIKKLPCPYLKRNGKLRGVRDTNKILNKIGYDIQKIYEMLKEEADYENSSSEYNGI